MATYIAPAALGLGDLVVALPVVQTLIAQGEKTFLVLRNREHASVAERVKGLAGFVFDWQVDAGTLAAEDRFIDLRDHLLQKDFWWGSPEFAAAYPNYRINEIVRHICKDKGLTPELKDLTPLKFQPRRDARGKLVFIPGSAIDAKQWGAEQWLNLADLANSQGLPVLMLGQPQHCALVEQLKEAAMPWVETPTLADAIDLISSSLAVVSVDTGLMHLAVHQKLPTVALYRQKAVYIRDFDHAGHFVCPEPCSQECISRERQAAHNHKASAGEDFSPCNWSCAYPDGHRCLDKITAEVVFAGLMSLMYSTKTSPIGSR